MPWQITSSKPRKKLLLPRKRIVVRECSENCVERGGVHLLALHQNDPVLFKEAGKDVDALRIAGRARIVPCQTRLIYIGRVARSRSKKGVESKPVHGSPPS